MQAPTKLRRRFVRLRSSIIRINLVVMRQSLKKPLKHTRYLKTNKNVNVMISSAMPELVATVEAVVQAVAIRLRALAARMSTLTLVTVALAIFLDNSLVVTVSRRKVRNVAVTWKQV